ncbi:M56 family metallopeptidase [Dyadobacter sp. CY343]|uniref:M56 family metallopeptidase n=1 Tax=Dyadobacter sp. CY343 TaxID=2907299 RepID=UPI001F2910E5|nr:M56 family metallopeptidase [Dyadobacter sp. CY343]MCE7063063.1 M48 family metalloprotease [Dyadobacter sp. CY343]
MKSISTFVSDSVISAFGWTLVHSLWQATALLIISLVAFYVLRKKSASTKYLAGVSLLFGQIVASVITFFYYHSKYSSPLPGLSNTVSLNKSNLNSLAQSGYELPISLKIQFWLTSHLHELVVCWVIGAAILLIRFLGGWLFTVKLRAQARVVMDKEWRARLGVIVAKMNIAKSVDFKETSKILTPMVIGTLSPVILVPIGFLSGFSTSQVEAILAHELAHIKRNDYLINLFQSFVEVIFFFHPAIWWLSDRIRAEREHCCDDIALAVCGDKMSLVHALVKVAEWQTAPRVAMAFASKKPLLLNRVQRVLGISPKTSRTIGSLPVLFFLITLAVSISVYAVAQKSEKPQEKKVVKQTAKKKAKQPLLVEVSGEIIQIPDEEIPEDIALHIEGLLEESAVLHLNSDSLEKKMSEISRRMHAINSEMEPFLRRTEEIHLEMEKQNFEVERVERELEKIEWKKERAMESRSELMEKRSSLLDRGNKSSQSKLTDTDLDKQLADYEQQIKVVEQTISELNTQISAARKSQFEAEQPNRKLEAEAEEVNAKIEELSKKLGIEALSIEKLEAASRPISSRVVQGTVHKQHRLAPPPPPPPVPAKVSKPAKSPIAPPPPPAPPKKRGN